MIFFLLTTVVTTILNSIFAFLPKVTVLPLGMDSAVQVVFGFMHGALIAFPMFQITWTLLLWYFGIKIGLLGLRFAILAVNFVRGSGASI